MTDTERLEWALPILTSDDEADARAELVAGALLMGKSGREALDLAISGDIPSGVLQAVRRIRATL